MLQKILPLYNGQLFIKTWHLRYHSADFFCQKHKCLSKKGRQKAPSMLENRERRISANIKIFRIASTAGVRTHGDFGLLG